MRPHPGLLAKTLLLPIAAGLLLAGCATFRGKTDEYAKVNPASLAADPAAWDGKQVEVVGLVVWEFENLGLYQSYGTYCRRGENVAVHVDWSNWPGVIRADNRRRVMVRGVFHNQLGVKQPNGSIVVSNAAPGPGPLQPGSIVRWLSPPLPACPAKALP